MICLPNEIWYARFLRNEPQFGRGLAGPRPINYKFDSISNALGISIRAALEEKAKALLCSFLLHNMLTWHHHYTPTIFEQILLKNMDTKALLECICTVLEPCRTCVENFGWQVAGFHPRNLSSHLLLLPPYSRSPPLLLLCSLKMWPIKLGLIIVKDFVVEALPICHRRRYCWNRKIGNSWIPSDLRRSLAEISMAENLRCGQFVYQSKFSA